MVIHKALETMLDAQDLPHPVHIQWEHNLQNPNKFSKQYMDEVSIFHRKQLLHSLEVLIKGS